MSRNLTWIGSAAVVLALLQLPWACVHPSAIPFWDAVPHQKFILLRAWLVAPAIGSTLLAVIALLPRRRGIHRILAAAALMITVGSTYLIYAGTHFHLGD